MDFAGLECVFLYCLASAFFKTVPFVSTFAIGLCGSIQCFFTSKHSHPLAFSLGVLAVYSYVDGRLATDIFEKKLKKINSAMVGMSVFLGLYAFGFEGIIYGPLLIALGHIIYEMLN